MAREGIFKKASGETKRLVAGSGLTVELNEIWFYSRGKGA